MIANSDSFRFHGKVSIGTLTMMKPSLYGLILLASIAQSFSLLRAQVPVTVARNPDQLFTSIDPKLHKNKQVAYPIQKDLLEHGHWELANKYLSEGYIQHNPNLISGRKGMVDFFTKVLNVKPTPIPAKMSSKVVSVVAEGDLVTVAFVKEEMHPKIPGKTYTTTWFDQWRIVNSRAVEHWDAALLNGVN